MIQANLLMATVGKAPNSFAVLDLMRLPLGILSGMGFIGAGAIVRRDNLVVGITTAATVTVIGLCFGGGQLLLGSVALVLGLVVLWGLKWLEQRTKRERRAGLTVVTSMDGPSEKDIQAYILASKDAVSPHAIAYRWSTDYRRFAFDIEWRARSNDTSIPAFVDELAKASGVLRVEWKPQ
jgi:putative Mg2+ transporter-C (MgtC) family protein